MEGGTKLDVNDTGHMIRIAAIPMYVKNLKNCFFLNPKPYNLEVWFVKYKVHLDQAPWIYLVHLIHTTHISGEHLQDHWSSSSIFEADDPNSQCILNNIYNLIVLLLRLHSILLAHLSRRLTGELIVYPCSGVRPAFTFSKIFSSETAWPIKAKLHVEHP